MLSGRELCRGLSCLHGMGLPGDPALAGFNFNCVHLFNDIGGGMVGTDQARNVAEVHESFVNVCKKRVGILEQPSCPAYANTFVGAAAPKVNNPTVGGIVEVCTDTFFWLMAFKQSEIDLKLTAAALPQGNSLLAGDLNRFGTGGPGPSSARGLRWRAYFSAHKKWPTPPAMPRQLADDGSFAAALLQTDAEAQEPKKTGPKPLLPGADSAEDTPRGLPKYSQNPCGKAKHVVPQSGTKYQIAPGSPDGAVGPVEVDGDLFTYCSSQFSEIMMGFAQTASVTVQMTKDWCLWQASVSSWVGNQEEFGHPDWTHRTCTGMENYVAFALRDQLSDANGGLSAQQVCKKVFLTIGAVHRSEAIVQDAWATSLRGAPTSGLPGPDNAEMKKMLQEAQAYANKIFSKLRGQKAAFEDLNTAKMDTAAFDPGSVRAQAPPPAAPDLPNSADLDASVLLELSVEQVRQRHRVDISKTNHLTAWGRAE